MKNFDTRVYSVADFLEWYSNDLLNLSPDFQRRSVWSEKAKSYLIDTLVRGKPIPKLIISQELKGSRNIRVVVDGQQRLRAVLEFINGDFKISRAHNREYAGLTFHLLPSDIQNDFLKYEMGVDLIFDMSYEDLLDTFTRINAYTVSLNPQEKFNAKYLGFFKQAAYSCGFKYVRYYVDSTILSKTAVTRMAEAELSADLLASLTDGIQTNKTIEQLYKKYEDNSGQIDQAVDNFNKIMSYIGEIYPPEQIKSTNWSRVQLFYTLFTTIGHLLFKLDGPSQQYNIGVEPKDIGKLRVRLDEVSTRYDDYTNDPENPGIPSDYRMFIDRSRRATTDTNVRIERTNFLCEKLVEVLAQ